MTLLDFAYNLFFTSACLGLMAVLAWLMGLSWKLTLPVAIAAIAITAFAYGYFFTDGYHFPNLLMG